MNDASPARRDKFRTYRARKKAQGLREVRVWVEDANAPGYREALERQILAINSAEDEREVLIWSERMAQEIWADCD